MFNKILIAIDGSKASMRALEKALEFNQSLQAELYILYVQKHYSRLEASMYSLAESTAGDGMQEYGEELVREAKAKVLATHPQMQVRGFTKVGPVARTINQFAKDKGIDLIVVGSRGSGDQEGFMLGSVSHKVASITDIPILLI